MIKRAALGAVFLSVASIGAAYASAFFPGGAPGWAPWVMAVGIALLMVATMALGAAREGRLGRLTLPFAFVFLVLTVGFGVVLALPAADPLDPELWLGLPPRAAVVLYGVGLLPLLAVPLAYALTFDEMTLSDEDLARVRAAAARLRSTPVVSHQSSVVRHPETDDRVGRVEVGS
jgi:hypothetical protein